MLPSKDRLTICFAHIAYQMHERFLPRRTGINSFGVRTHDEFERRISEADVVVVSGMWRNELLEKRRGSLRHGEGARNYGRLRNRANVEEMTSMESEQR